MKKSLAILLLIYILTPAILCAEKDKEVGQFFITKVNRIEKMYVIPPERRDFMGSRGVEKFDYQRLLPNDERGENYIVTFRYRGKQLTSPLKLKFEYRLALDLTNLCVEEYEYPNLKTDSYKWTFENLEPRYIAKGKVDRWKVSLVLDGKVVAEKRSSSWYAMEGT